jgi:threonine dehydrogenase-like Zn-dependent dehydrogenase
MRALVYEQQRLSLDKNYAEPVPVEGQALLRIRKAGICNTDMELVRGYMGFSGVLGHEFVAEVVAGDPRWLGKRVVGEINIAEGDCDMCRLGIPSQCRHRTTMGIDRHQGAFADLMALTAHNLYEVPDNVSDDQAVFVEPLAAALQILEAVHIQPRQKVVVVGAGKLGLLSAQVLRLSGADVSVVVRREKPARLLAQWGIPALSLDELEPKQAQVVVDCTGNAEGFASALELVQPRGTIVLKSTYAEMPKADLTRVVIDEIRVVGSRCGPFGAALRLLSARLIDVTSLIDGRYSFDEALIAFDKAFEAGALKFILEF